MSPIRCGGRSSWKLIYLALDYIVLGVSYWPREESHCVFWTQHSSHRRREGMLEKSGSRRTCEPCVLLCSKFGANQPRPRVVSLILFEIPYLLLYSISFSLIVSLFSIVTRLVNYGFVSVIQYSNFLNSLKCLFIEKA